MADTIYHAVNIFPGDGVKTQWDFQFDGVIPDAGSGTTPYLFPDDVKAQEVYTDLTGVEVAIDRDVQLVAPATLKVLGDPIVVGHNVRIYRETEVRYPLVDYRDRQVVTEADLDLQARQTLFAVMEVTDTANASAAVASGAAAAAAAATVVANEAKAAADASVATADAAQLAAGQAVALATAADTKSDQALLAAAAAEDHATNVETLAADAQAAAVAAQLAATAATDTASNALSVANAIDAKATSALETADDAEAKADQALLTANSIDAKATEALDTANTAKATADTAKATADAVDAKAQQALDDSADALALANSFDGRIDVLEAHDNAITPFARQLLDDPDAATMRQTLAIVGGNTAQITGFRVNTGNSNDISISPGAAWVPGLNKLVVLSSGLVDTPPRTVAGFWHVYLTETAGSPAVSYSQSAPVLYLGGARVMTGNTSQRYLGTYLVSSALNVFSQQHEPQIGRVRYLVAAFGNAPFIILNGSSTTSVTTVNGRNFAPETAVSLVVTVSTLSPGPSLLLGTPNQSNFLTAAQWLNSIRPGSTDYMDINIDMTDNQRNFSIVHSATGGSTAMYGMGYYYER